LAKKIVVVGGVACGPKSASRARRLDPTAEITLVEKGELLSYAGCGLPYFLSGDVKDSKELMETAVGVLRDTVFFKNVKDINVMNNTLAESIDRKKKVVSTVNVQTGEKTELPYDKLVLATGGTPFVPPIPGVDLNRVFTLCCVEDARAIDTAVNMKEVKKAVIVGGGLIGLEVTEALVERGLEVTVVEMLDRILPQLFEFEMAAFLEKHLVSNGVKIMTSTTVKEIKGDGAGNATSVVTDAGDIPADLVIVAVGTRPNDKLGADSGLKAHEKGGLIVNDNMETSDPDIYAGGDCVVQKEIVGGKTVYVPLGSTANRHGRVIGTNITGGKDTFKGICSAAIMKAFEFNASRTGLNETDCKNAGIDFVTTLAISPDKAHFYPTAKPIGIKLIADRKTRKLLGAQIIGPGEVSKRIDVVTTAITFGATVDDVANLDLSYAPPFAPALDNLTTAANIVRNKIDGLAKSVTPMEVKEKLDKGDDFVLLDVRMPVELEEQGRMPSDNVIHIPLGKLRSEIDKVPKDKEIIAFCKISLRGYEAQKTLEGFGYKDVKFMDGGVLLWPYEKR
jgi:NADPH-dependent 2,4-dienoyl-CoA reductase/sulfur reductase-like enzyme/rhodanese-related sulfurtransferase